MSNALRPGVSLVGTITALEAAWYPDRETGEKIPLEGLFSLKMSGGAREIRADFTEFDDLGDRTRVFAQWKDGHAKVGDFAQVVVKPKVSKGGYVNFDALHIEPLKADAK